MKRSCRDVYQKLAPDSFLILVNNPKQPLHARNCFKKRYFEEVLSEVLELLEK